MPSTIAEQWETYKNEALVFVDGSFTYSIGDIKDDFYAGAVAALTLLAGLTPTEVDATMTELALEAKEYFGE